VSAQTVGVISVTASGLVTAVGFNSAASCAAMRAGISGVKMANLWDAESAEYISAGKVALPQWWESLGKLAELAAPAIHECLVAAKPVPPDQIPIMLGVAAPSRPFRLEGVDQQLLEEIEYRLGVPRHPLSRVIPWGNVAGVGGIQEARRLIQSGDITHCIVAGADTYLRQNTVEAYMDSRRIMTLDNSNGFFPGEAGSAVLVTATRDNPGGELEVLGIGVGRETATIDSEEPLRGDGLADAIRSALVEADLTTYEASYRLTDLNGEHYKFKEAVLATMRFEHKRRPEIFDLWHPIEYLGDVGAAIVPCVLAVALHAGQKSYAPGKVALCHFGNDDGLRAAMVVGFRPDVRVQ
jgi:3-oxoacyl-[acyl-carrier-protein] synthase I